MATILPRGCIHNTLFLWTYLCPPAVSQQAYKAHLTMTDPSGSASAGRATVCVNALGPLDLLQIAVSSWG